MNTLLNIHTAGNNETGVIIVSLFGVITLLIGGILNNGEHLHVGIRLWEYEVSFQLHNHKEDINQISTSKAERE